MMTRINRKRNETQLFTSEEAIAIIDRCNSDDNNGIAPVGAFKADAERWVDENAEKLAQSIYDYLTKKGKNKKKEFVLGFRYGCNEMIRRIYQ